VRILFLGGTRFAGRHMVEAALSRGHQVTLFNRGQSNPDLFPGLERIRGDRDGGLAPLEGRRFDAVVDTCGYVPRVVRASARVLAGSAGHYTFVSSMSVYPDETPPGLTEEMPVSTIVDATVEEITDETYGALKALCEHEVSEAFPDATLVLRCGLIVGPFDPSDRFTYWPHRVARGGEILAPGPPDYRLQVIDARDLAEWTLKMIESGQAGVFNAVGPAEPFTLKALLETCREVSGSDARFTWVTEEFITEAGAEPWSDLPLWLPAGFEGVMQADVSKVARAGLQLRPLPDTVRDTLAWDATLPADRELKAGLTPEREAELLAAWRTRGAR
jgi:2'-hydroxyisoflavone reductase